MRENPNQIRIPPLFPWQSDFLSRQEHIIAIGVGRRSGKSVALALRMLLGPKGLIQGKNVALMAHKEQGLGPVEREIRNFYGRFLVPGSMKNRFIFTPTGAEVHLWTLGNKKTAMEVGRGEHYGTIVIDEAAYCTGLYEAFQSSIEPTLADDDGHAIFSSTPKGTKNDFYRIYKNLAEITIEGSTTACNPLPRIQAFVKRRQRDATKGIIDPRLFRQEYCGEFVDMGGCLVGKEMIQHFDIEPNVLIARDIWQIHFGVDLAFSGKEKLKSDWTAIVVVARNRATQEFFVIDVVRFKEQNPHFVLHRIRELAKVWTPSKIAVEATPAQGAIIRGWQTEELGRDLPIVGLRPEKDKEERFGPTASLYAQGRIYHAWGSRDEDEDIPELDPTEADLKEMSPEERMDWQVRKEERDRQRGYDVFGEVRLARYRLPQYFEDELILFPIAEHDDMCDALAYAIMSFGNYWDDNPSSGTQWARQTGEEVYNDDSWEAA